MAGWMKLWLRARPRAGTRVDFRDISLKNYILSRPVALCVNWFAVGFKYMIQIKSLKTIANP